MQLFERFSEFPPQLSRRQPQQCALERKMRVAGACRISYRPQSGRHSRWHDSCGQSWASMRCLGGCAFLAVVRVATASELLCVARGGTATLPPVPQQEAIVWARAGSVCDLRTLDGNLSASGSRVCHWEARVATAEARWRLEATLVNGGGSVCAGAFSPDGLQVLVGSADGSSAIWRLSPMTQDAHTSQVLQQLVQWSLLTSLPRHLNSVRVVAWSPDGLKALTGSADGAARIWSNGYWFTGVLDPSITDPPPAVERWKLLDMLAGHSEQLWAAHWKSNKSRLLTGRPDRTGCLKEVLPTRFFGEDLMVLSCVNSSRFQEQTAFGSTVLRNSYDRTARIWSAEWPEVEVANATPPLDNWSWPPTWEIEARLQDRHRHSHIVLAAAWSNDGEKVLTGSSDGIARVWYAGGRPREGLDIGADPNEWELLSTLKGHLREIWSVAWSPDDALFLTGGRDGVTNIWERRPTAPFWQVAGTIQEIRCQFTVDDVVESVFYGGLDVTDTVIGDLAVWEKDKLLVLSPVPAAYLVVFTRNLEPFACRTGGFAMKCSNSIGTDSVDVDLGWEAVGSAEELPRSLYGDGGGSGWTAPGTSTSRFHLNSAPSTRKLCATNDSYAAYRVRLSTQSARGVAAFGQRVRYSGSPVGVSAAGVQEHVSIESELQRTFVESPRAIGSNAFRSQGEQGYPQAAWSASWSPDGEKVAAGGRDGVVRIWRMLDASWPMQWRLEATLSGHTGVVWSVNWSPDGQKVITAGQDGLARIWTV